MALCRSVCIRNCAHFRRFAPKRAQFWRLYCSGVDRSRVFFDPRQRPHHNSDGLERREYQTAFAGRPRDEFFSVFEPLTETASSRCNPSMAGCGKRGGTTPQALEYRHSVPSATGLAGSDRSAGRPRVREPAGGGHSTGYGASEVAARRWRRWAHSVSVRAPRTNMHGRWC